MTPENQTIFKPKMNTVNTNDQHTIMQLKRNNKKYLRFAWALHGNGKTTNSNV